MQGVPSRHAAFLSGVRCMRVAAVLMLGLGAAGCSGSGPVIGTFADARKAPIAFESIDGPPAEIVRNLVRALKEEATARQIVVVARDAAPAYRIRGYLAARTERGGSSVAWVWDVYDNDQHRAFRLTGEEKAGAGSRGGWPTAADPALRRIARAGMDQLATFMTAGPPQTEPPRPLQGLFAGLSDAPAAGPQLAYAPPAP